MNFLQHKLNIDVSVLFYLTKYNQVTLSYIWLIKRRCFYSTEPQGPSVVNWRIFTKLEPGIVGYRQ